MAALSSGQTPRLRPLLRPVALGLSAALGLLAFYLVVITLAQEWAHALQQLAEDLPYVGAKLIGSPDVTSLLLVTPEDGVAPTTLRERLDDLPATDALLKSAMANNDEKLFARAFGGPLRLMVAIALLVGALVVGLVIYTATVERQMEYGVLKAVGARNRTLYSVVATQALISAGLGSVLGVGLAYGASWIIVILRPEFLVAIEPQAVGLALLMGVVMALLGAILLIRKVAKLAPAEVFRR